MRLSTKRVRRKSDGEIVTVNASDLQRPELAELYDPVPLQGSDSRSASGGSEKKKGGSKPSKPRAKPKG